MSELAEWIRRPERYREMVSVSGDDICAPGRKRQESAVAAYATAIGKACCESESFCRRDASESELNVCRERRNRFVRSDFTC